MSEEENSNSSEAHDLDRVRQILFGAFAQDVEARLEQLQKKMTAEFSTVVEEINRLQQSTNERFEASTKKLQHEVATLQSAISNSREESDERRREIHDRITGEKQDLQQQISSLGNTLAAAEQSLRHDMGRGYGELKDEIRVQLEEINQRMQHEVTRLDGATVTRTSFRDALRALSSQFDQDGASE